MKGVKAQTTDLQRIWSGFMQPQVAITYLVTSHEGTADHLSLTAAQLEKLNQLTSKRRRQEWITARGIEQLLRTELGECSTSISHAPILGETHVLGVGVRGSENIGVDFEDCTRVIKPATYKFFADPKELEIGLAAIELWVVKEACFKALPKNVQTVLANLKISNFDPDGLEGKMTIASSKVSIRFRLVRLKPYIVAFAHSMMRPG